MKRKVLCVFVLFVCVMLLAGCGAPLEQSRDYIRLTTWHFTSGIPNNGIEFNLKENATFECSVNYGEFWVMSKQEFASKATLANGEIVYWAPTDGKETFEQAWVDVIVKENDQIIGYATIKITHEAGLDYTAEVVKSVIFPQVYGKSQQITQEQAEQLIKDVKN